VVRLTLPTQSSFLAHRENRSISSREGFLVFSSDRDGAIAPFRANLKTGAVTRLAETQSLRTDSLCLDSREHELWFVDEHALKAVDLQRLKTRTVLEGVDAFHLNGRRNVVVVQRGEKLERWAPNGSAPLAEDVSSRGLISPSGEGCVFGRRSSPDLEELWYVPVAGGKPRLLAKGNIASPCWRPDSQTVLFLRFVDRTTYVSSEITEVALDGSAERKVAATSQFISFTPNGDGTVFVGASRSKAQPNIVLLLRSVGREMVLCEHRAHQAELVSPIFSPNSQRVYFESDREGKPAIYSVNVERFVDQTGDETS
jgi:oligogalacturonide lyase